MSCCQKKSTVFLQEKKKLFLFNLNSYQNTFILWQCKNKIRFSPLAQESLQEKTLFSGDSDCIYLLATCKLLNPAFWIFRRAEMAFEITLIAKWQHMSGSKVSPLSARFPTAEDSNDCSLKDVWIKVFSQKTKQIFFMLRKLFGL